MKKFMISASALALSGSMAFAMDEDAMDEEMMMEAPAPSVTLTGEAEIGFKNVDDDLKPNAETIQLVRAYKVTFGSQGTTDGGLVFGAGISIRDDTTEDDGTGRNAVDGSSSPVVKGSNVYIGAADGTWKLKFGGNDAGALVAGGIGVADDQIDRGDAEVGLEGSFGDTSYRLTVADPQDGGDDWSVGVKHSLGDYAIGLGLTSDDGVVLGLSASLGGVNSDLYYSKTEFDEANIETLAPVAAENWNRVQAHFVTQYEALNKLNDEFPTGTGATNANNPFIAPTGDPTGNYASFLTLARHAEDELRMGRGLDLTDEQFLLLANEIRRTTDSSLTDAFTISTDDETAGQVVPPDAITPTDDNEEAVAARERVRKILTALNASRIVDGVLRDDQILSEKGTADINSPAFPNVLAGTTEYTGLGASFAIPAGEGTNLTVAFSRLTAQTTPGSLPEGTRFDDGDSSKIKPYGGGEVKTDLIKLGIEYALGGGATLNASVEQKSTEEIMIVTQKLEDDDDYNHERVGKKSAFDTTTLKATLAFSF